MINFWNRVKILSLFYLDEQSSSDEDGDVEKVGFDSSLPTSHSVSICLIIL